MVQHYLDDSNIAAAGFVRILDRAAELKRLRGTPEHPRPLAGKSIGLIMEKASTRTRISFEVGIHELGGQPLALAGRDLQLGRDEPLEDTARVLSRYMHGVVMRTHGHERLVTLSAASSVPIINALTDKFHPCQVLADLMTVREHRKAGFADMSVAWVGDGNNMAHSWIIMSAVVGFELRLACPKGYAPARDVLEAADRMGRGRRIVTEDVDAAVRGVHVVTTDVWASMGQESEREARVRDFSGYCVTDKRMRMADSGALFLHCLPAHRGEEVEASVIDGPHSVVWDEAENRLHVQKALLEWLCGGAASPK